MRSAARRPNGRLVHSALCYAGDDDFLRGVLPFVRCAVDDGEPVLVTLPPDHLDLVRDRLDGYADAVQLADMSEVGRNPNRMIARVAELVRTNPGRRAHAVGEPLWHSRTTDELAEVARFEALVNLAFAGADASFLCPYSAALPAEVVANVARTHPSLAGDGRHHPDEKYTAPRAFCAADNWPLAPPPADAVVLPVEGLGAVRAQIHRCAQAAGLSEHRVHDALVTVNELGTNSLNHADGSGILRIWVEPNALCCEVRDDGHIADPLAGTLPTATAAATGRGLFMVNQLADLVQLRSSSSTGTIVRVRFNR
jgi:anti-sigma regulatory factor (Ser/Thr protein kinase)